MDSCNHSTRIHSFVYLFLVSVSVHFLHTLLISPKLTIDYNQNARLKKLAPTPLRFRADGTFKILQVADMHFGNGKLTRCRDVLESEFNYCSDLNTTRFLEKMILLESPDFVAFTGDNIFGSSATDAAESLFQVFDPVIKSGIPWAAVLGNHDQESTMTREELMSFISLMDFSLSQTFPSVEDNSNSNKQSPVPRIDGFGNYNLRVMGAPGSSFANSSVFNLYFLDSGDRATVNGVRTYDWIKESQLNWLRCVSRKAQVNSNEQPPSLAFFHIPIPEIRRGPVYNVVGQYREYVACSLVNSGVLDTLVSMGDKSVENGGIKRIVPGDDDTQRDFLPQFLKSGDTNPLRLLRKSHGVCLADENRQADVGDSVVRKFSSVIMAVSGMVVLLSTRKLQRFPTTTTGLNGWFGGRRVFNRCLSLPESRALCSPDSSLAAFTPTQSEHNAVTSHHLLLPYYNYSHFGHCQFQPPSNSSGTTVNFSHRPIITTPFQSRPQEQPEVAAATQPIT
ncbi:probable inactive purple acid phosphatase 28 [Phtheirospermum japonicum]|uniref:Probable inactive purple acid phosphatase 28 n=1 Tax=Phtheirospermum japonicum TaxID=374723 RepID=A0A830B9L7_9LAMI|nr:probable inactive purple acid phosphatase 28 [Phtheirospermum japonicum]